eukprot:4171617-Pleurochrysis_carterae.AAC.1
MDSSNNSATHGPRGRSNLLAKVASLHGMPQNVQICTLSRKNCAQIDYVGRGKGCATRASRSVHISAAAAVGWGGHILPNYYLITRYAKDGSKRRDAN